MKAVIVALGVSTFFLSLMGCSDDPPSIRVTNLRATKANVQIKQSNANTINHNDVVGGTSSNYQDIVAGGTVVTAVIQNESVSPTTAFNAAVDNNYTVVIMTGDPPTLRIDMQGK